MQSLNFLFLIFLHAQFLLSEENYFKNLSEEEYTFLLFALNKENENVFAKISVDKLKKSNFPDGPHRFNQLSDTDFIKIDEKMKSKILQEKEIRELPVFCIEICNQEGKCKACGFELPVKGKLSYVFCLGIEFTEIKGCIISEKNLNEILNKKEEETNSIDDALASAIDDATEQVKEKPVAPKKTCMIYETLNKYWLGQKTISFFNWAKIKTQQFGFFILMKIAEFKDLK